NYDRVGGSVRCDGALYLHVGTGLGIEGDPLDGGRGTVRGRGGIAHGEMPPAGQGVPRERSEKDRHRFRAADIPEEIPGSVRTRVQGVERKPEIVGGGIERVA